MKFKLSFRETIIFFATLIVVLYFLFDFFLYSPKQKERSMAEQELAAMKQKIQDTLVFFSTQGNVVAEIAGMERKLSFYEEKFSKKEQFSRFLEQLAQQCKKLNMEVLALHPREEKFLPLGSAQTEYRQVFIDMELRCDYRTVVLYMQALDTLPVFTIVEQLDIRRDEKSPTVTCHIVLKTLFS